MWRDVLVGLSLLGMLVLVGLVSYWWMKKVVLARDWAVLKEAEERRAEERCRRA